MSTPVVLAISELEVGGTQRQMLELAKRLDRRLFVPEVCCLSRSLAMADEFRKNGINVRLIEKRARYDISVLPRLRAFFREEKVSVLITYGFTADAWCRVAGRLVGIPVIISSVRTPDEESRLRDFVNRVLSSITDHYVANSDAVVAYLRRIGIPQEKCSLIPNGIAVERIHSSGETRNSVRATLGIPLSSFVVGTVSRLSPEKNVEEFLRIGQSFLSVCPEVVLVVIGDGPQRGQLHALANDLGLSDRIRWLGERMEVRRLIEAYDVAMLASRREGLSNSLLECMAAGLPLVASAVGGNPELIHHGQTGFLYPVGQIEEAVQFLTRLHREPPLRARVGDAARRDVGLRFGMDALVNRTQELLLKLLEQKAGRPHLERSLVSTESVPAQGDASLSGREGGQE
jgi:glycosyltransferase involved in cell wall biosynthesis